MNPYLLGTIAASVVLGCAALVIREMKSAAYNAGVADTKAQNNAEAADALKKADEIIATVPDPDFASNRLHSGTA